MGSGFMPSQSIPFPASASIMASGGGPGGSAATDGDADGDGDDDDDEEEDEDDVVVDNGTIEALRQQLSSHPYPSLDSYLQRGVCWGALNTYLPEGTM